jgi:hypothetical protein
MINTEKEYVNVYPRDIFLMFLNTYTRLAQKLRYISRKSGAFY